MNGPLYRFFADDHRRLEEFLNRAATDPAAIDTSAYDEFRRGLLKHIGLEEKILLPAAQQVLGEAPFPMAAKLRLDHGALAALTVPPPSPGVIAALRAILTDHDRLEEVPGGVYDQCERLIGDGIGDLLIRLRRAPDLEAMPPNPDPRVLDAVRRAMTRAGYNFDDYAGM
ncbi:MAG TPA: hemerythrin domain-containing protein [Nitrospiria bacterium]|jgi:hypothetical protein|nr:hemerythrin domain-containing protein [Nitrospiria bacterium]